MCTNRASGKILKVCYPVIIVVNDDDEGKFRDAVFKLPQAAYDKIQKSATSHPPERIVNPSKKWGLDIFEDE